MNKIPIRFGVGFFFVFFILIKNGHAQSIAPLIDSPGKTIGSDFNGDGIHDIIVGASGNDDGPGTGAGATYIFFGATTLSGTKSLGEGASADVTILGKAASDLSGNKVASAGDVNGDGLDDVILGAYFNDEGPGNSAGAVYILFGSTTLSGTKSLGEGASADFTIIGKAASDFLGNSVSGAGDVNGDGFDDVIMGARQNDDGPGTGAGAAYVLFGASDLSGTIRLGEGESADFTVLGKADSDFLGFNLSGAGDVNGDGFDDVMVGAYGNDDGPGTGAGAAYVLFGASNLSGTKSLGEGASADVTVLGKAASDYLGKYVASTGDVNGDGFNDILVAAQHNDDGPGSNNAGAGYIFFGASGLSGTKSLGEGQSADVTILGKAAQDYLGRNVSTGGDINDDGFDDVFIAAIFNDDGAGNSGAGYIFFGSRDLSGTKRLGGGESADVTILGKALTDYMGRGLSGVGDVNVDGIPDVIIGAERNDDGAGGNNEGAAYVFFGATDLSGTKTAGTDQNVEILGKAANDNLGKTVGGGRGNPGP